MYISSVPKTSNFTLFVSYAADWHLIMPFGCLFTAQHQMQKWQAKKANEKQKQKDDQQRQSALTVAVSLRVNNRRNGRENCTNIYVQETVGTTTIANTSAGIIKRE